MGTLYRALLLLCLVVAGNSFLLSSVFAWEFSMEGEFDWRTRFVSQLGSSGFFGQYNLDSSSTPGNFASVNGWPGGKLEGLVSSSGAAEQRMETNLLPRFQINQAMRFSGEYRIGSFGDPVASAYVNSNYPGVQVAISEGQWTMWWFTAQTPWGAVAVGKRPFNFGCGLQYNGAEDLTSESLLLVAPYGPVDIGLGFYPWRRQPGEPLQAGSTQQLFPATARRPACQSVL